MEMNLFSLQNFERTWQDCPPNLFLFPLEVLEAGMEFSHETKVTVLAELFVRAFLAGKNCPLRLTDIINRELPHGELGNFMELFPGPQYRRDELDGALWKSTDEFSQCCQAAVRRRFQLLFGADGFIPVFLDSPQRPADKGFLIPFEFLPEGPSGVYDLFGQEIPEWSEYAKLLGIDVPVMLHYCQCSNGLSVGGSSMMLPLQLAWWRKTGQLPRYNVFRVVATGRFDAQLRLASVATETKAKALAENFQSSLFLYPESVGMPPLVGGGNFALACGISLDAVLVQVRKAVERLARLDTKYAQSRLVAFNREVRLENRTNWAAMLERLENAAVFTRRKNPEAYLTILLLQAEAHCHAGQTRQAMELNSQARAFARELGPHVTKLATRAEIDFLVLQQDFGKFAETIQLGANLASTLEELQDTDLWMRYHGTMGQAHMYGTIQGASGCSAELAKEHLEAAVDCAMRLGSAEDLAQDLNYLHLWFAFFAPGCAFEQDAWREAYNHNIDLKEENFENYRKNLPYLKRSQALAWYRYWLQNGDVPEDYRPDAEFQVLFADDMAEPWIKVCVAKCLGALEAANGNRPVAEQWFQKMRDSIYAEKHPGIVTLIFVAGLAEDYHTLGVEYARETALELLNQLDAAKDTLGELPATIAKYRNYLTGQADFPARAFWY